MKKLFTSDSRRPIVLALAIGVLASLGFISGLLGSWSARVNDRFFLSHSSDPSIMVVAIDDASIGQLGRWPWSRQVHASLINALKLDGAKVIAYDVNFPEVSDATNDQALADALKSAGNVVLPVELQLETAASNLSYDPAHILSPISLIASNAAATGHTNILPDADGIARRVALSVGAPDHSTIPSFVAQVAQLDGMSANLSQAPVDGTQGMIVNFPNAPFKGFRTVSAVDVIRGAVDPSLLNGKVVFVGSTAADLHDSLLVPTSLGLPMPGIEIHASAFDTIVTRNWLQQAPAWALVLLILFYAFVAGFAAAHMRARESVLGVLVVWIVYVVCVFVLFDKGWIADLIWPTLALFVSYGAVTLERRVTIDRQRRELKVAFSRYVSQSVVDSILRDPNRLKLGGERRRMSVLFSDIRGFTTLSEGMTPEDLVHVLNIYLNRMTNIVFEHQGVLDKYIGDAVMAFWNAPLDQPSHALLAVKTALDWQTALNEMNEAKAFGDIQIHIGAGVNTGDMVVGNVGGDARFDYTVIGDNVNLGSRLEGLTKEYGVHVIVSEATMKELGDEVLVRKLDKVAVKGKKEPVVIYEAMEMMKTATEERKSLAKDFEAALELYFARKFTEASTSCESILKKYPGDGPAKNLLERAQHFTQNPPEEGWVGTWVFTKK